jgi:hypothetical protein
MEGGWKIIAECDPKTRSRRDSDDDDDEELNKKSIGWPMNEEIVPPSAILNPKRLGFTKCDDFLPILDKKSPQRQWISWISSVKSCSPQKKSREGMERRSRSLGKGKSLEGGATNDTQEITFTTEALVLEKERNDGSDGMLRGKVVMFGVNHSDEAKLKSPTSKILYPLYPREWVCRGKVTFLAEDKVEDLAEKLLTPIGKINRRFAHKVTSKEHNDILSRINDLMIKYHFPFKDRDKSVLKLKTHILSLPWKVQYELLKEVLFVLKFDTANFFMPSDKDTTDYNDEYPINLECSMGMETQLTYTKQYPYNKEVLTLYLHHLQKMCSFPENCVPKNLLGTELDRVLQPRLSTLEDSKFVNKESDSYSKIMCKLLESFRISCGANAILIHDVLYINSFKITIYNATQRKVGFYVKYFPDLKLVKNYVLFDGTKETKINSLGTVTRLVQCYKEKEIENLHKEIFLRMVSQCPKIKQCQKYPINKYFRNKEISSLWDDCITKNHSLAKFIERSRGLDWDSDDEEKWEDATGDLTFNGFLIALLFNNEEEEGFFPILLNFDEQKRNHVQYMKDVYNSRFYMYKHITENQKKNNYLYIRNVPATYAELKSNVDVYKYNRRPSGKDKKDKQSKRPRRRLSRVSQLENKDALLKSSSSSAQKFSPAAPPLPAKKSKPQPAKKSKSHSPPAKKSKSHSPPAKKSKSPPQSQTKKSHSPRQPVSSKSQSPNSDTHKSPSKKNKEGPKNTKFPTDRSYVQIVTNITNKNKCADINQEKDPHELISWNCKPYKGEGGDDSVNQWFAYNQRTSHIISAITDMCLYVDEVKENERVHQGDCNKPNNKWEFIGKNLMLKGTDFALYTSKKGYFIISKKFPRQEYRLRKSPKTEKKYLDGINIPAEDN